MKDLILGVTALLCLIPFSLMTIKRVYKTPLASSLTSTSSARFRRSFVSRKVFWMGLCMSDQNVGVLMELENHSTYPYVDDLTELSEDWVWVVKRELSEKECENIQKSEKSECVNVDKVLRLKGMNKDKKYLLVATVLAVTAYCAKSIYDSSEVTLSDATMAYPNHYVSKVCDGGYTIKVEGTGQVRFDERVNDYLPTSDITYTCESSIAGTLNSVTPLNIFTPAPFNVDDFTVFAMIKKPEHKPGQVQNVTSRWAKKRFMTLSEVARSSSLEILEGAQKAALDAVELSLLDKVGSASAKMG